MKHRLNRVCEVIKRELGTIMLRDLTFTSPLVTINSVDITPDLKQAHIYVSAMGSDADSKNAVITLVKNRKFLQAELAKKIILRQTPHLNFKLDESIVRGTRVIQIMSELNIPEDEETPTEPTEETDEQK